MRRAAITAALVLALTACGGGGGGEPSTTIGVGTPLVSGQDTGGNSGNVDDTLGAGDDGADPGAEAEVGFVSSGSGNPEFDLSGGTLCFVSDGQFDIDFFPDQVVDLRYVFSSPAFTEPGTYEGVARIFKTDGSGDSAETEGTLIVNGIENYGTGFVTVSGTLTAAFSEGVFGAVDLEIDWSCFLDEAELENA